MAKYVTNPCEECGAAVTVLASQHKRGRGRTCSRQCSSAKANRERREREREGFAKYFWNWVDKSAGPEACWPWLGKHTRRGYGRYRLDRRSHFAHRYALRATLGDPPTGEASLALHSCDNPPCCNPAHLRWGTPKDNMDDRRNRGRAKSHPHKISRSELARLRAEGRSYSELAAHFGVNQASIGKALLRALIKDQSNG